MAVSPERIKRNKRSYAGYLGSLLKPDPEPDPDPDPEPPEGGDGGGGGDEGGDE